MDANERKEYAAAKLASARAGILENAGKGEAAITALLPPEVEAYRMMLKARLAAERGRTYTYRDPNNIPTGEIKVNMGANEHILARPPGWKDDKKNKKKDAALPGGASGQSSQYSGQQRQDGTSGYRSGGNSGGTSGGYGLAGTYGGTRITGSGSGGYSAIPGASGGGGWFGKLLERLTDDD